MSVLDWLTTAAPDVAVEIDRTHVGAARVEWRGGVPVVTAQAVEALPGGAVTPALASLNMTDVGAVGQVVARVLTQLGGRIKRVALVVPDAVAKVSLLRLETVPPRATDLREIIKWQVRKSVPFAVEQSVLSVSPGAPSAEGGREFVVALAREDVIRQYEQACAMAGAEAGLVDLATFGILNSVVAGGLAPQGDWLLVHVADSYITLAVVRGEHLIFIRHRSEESEGTLADLIHQTAMYYEDRLKGAGFSRVWLAGTAALVGADSVRRDLETRLGIGVESVEARTAAALVDRVGASPELADALAPLIGVLRHDGRAA
jgi:type IV pilus assembly protein PilM